MHLVAARDDAQRHSKNHRKGWGLGPRPVTRLGPAGSPAGALASFDLFSPKAWLFTVFVLPEWLQIIPETSGNQGT